MKAISIFLLWVLISCSGYTQEIMFNVRGSSSQAIKKDQLLEANTLNDIKANYPSSWITNYTVVVIKTISAENTFLAEGVNDTLNVDQKHLLQSAAIGTDVVFDISHLYKNSVTGVPELRHVAFAYTIVPDVEATYVGGTEQLNAYLEEKAINKISTVDAKKFGSAEVSFVVNEKGGIENAKITTSSGDPKTDKVLLSAINKMPNWQSAENKEGLKVRQTFLFTVGSGGC